MKDILNSKAPFKIFPALRLPRSRLTYLSMRIISTRSKWMVFFKSPFPVLTRRFLGCQSSNPAVFRQHQGKKMRSIDWLIDLFIMNTIRDPMGYPTDFTGEKKTRSRSLNQQQRLFRLSGHICALTPRSYKIGSHNYPSLQERGLWFQ